MRAFNFMKIDYIKTKQQMLFLPLLLALIAGIMIAPDSDILQYSAAMPFWYMVFMMTIFAATPFGTCKRQESGFLKLLPASTWDRVAGRFLFGLSLMAIAVAFGVGAMAVYHMLGYGIGEADIPMCMIGLAAGIVMMTVQYVVFYLFGENWGQNLLSIVRTVPGMCMFFVAANVSKELSQDPEQVVRIIETVGMHLNLIALVSLAASIVAFAAAIVLCVKVSEERDG